MKENITQVILKPLEWERKEITGHEYLDDNFTREEILKALLDFLLLMRFIFRQPNL